MGNGMSIVLGWLILLKFLVFVNNLFALYIYFWSLFDWMRLFFRIRKILNLRVFNDSEDARWKKSLKDENKEVLCVSQV